MNKVQKAFTFTACISIFLITAFSVLLGCQSSSQETMPNAEVGVHSTYAPQKPDAVTTITEPSQVDLKDATPVKLGRKTQSYFGSIDKTVLQDLEIASPSSINRGLNKMRKAAIEYTESERVIYNISSRIMSEVWSKENQLVNVPAVSQVSGLGASYLAIMDSAKSGIFENRKGEKDFFLTVLPALVILSSTENTGYYADAETALLSGLKMKPDSVLCNYLLGKLYEKQKQYEKAVACFEKATEPGTTVFEVLYEKAACLVALGHYEAASSILDRLVIQFPSDVQVLKLYANATLLMGDFPRAELYASQVLQQNPSDLEFVLFRAKIFVETGEYLKASSLLDVYAKSFPTQHEYLLLRAKLQKEWNKNLTVAISTIEKALSLYPDDEDIILYAAQLASETGSRVSGKTGVQLAELILKDDPDNVKGLQYSVQSLYNEGRYSEAYTLSKKLLGDKAVPQRAVLMHTKVCLAMHYNDEAWKYAASLYEKNSDNIEIIQHYIEVMIKTGRTQSASKLINSMLSGTPSANLKSFLFYERSFLTSNEGTMLSDLRSSLIANPRNSDALFRMYQIYYGRKDYRKAQYYLKQVVSLNPNDEKYLRLNSELDQLLK
ncbi:MAG: tetratricopeptide repeat protein [Treponema sp.]|uniref:tetratricopeptide repeat protein n=1 Tax=Treponema sp. TaxID=166 RepID=UPI00298DF951|nr:tetratricopeptide repeat protein [Treponema sp.]MDD5811134.1 tetratricopeptide repeat protein [Treponema sp.]